MLDELRALLDEKGIILEDGAMGTTLTEVCKLEGGTPPEVCNIDHPDQVQAMHRAYIDVGSRVILTNTIGGNRYRLRAHDLEDQLGAINRKAAEIARKAADSVPHRVFVAGSIGPTGEMLAPLGLITEEEAAAAFAEQAAALDAGRVDFFQIETFIDLNEAAIAAKAASEASTKPVFVTISFGRSGRTMMGNAPEDVAEKMLALEIAGFGTNCGDGIPPVEVAIEAMRSVAPDAILIAKPNAGIPKLIDGENVFDASPADMAEAAQDLRGLGANLIGGCCGTTPDHLKAMHDALSL
jgi:5-methyltetrahydrofolate--homocysteine methyltransferase